MRVSVKRWHLLKPPDTAVSVRSPRTVSTPRRDNGNLYRKQNTYQHQLLVLLLQQAAIEELVQRHNVRKVEALAAQALVGAPSKAQAHNGLALRRKGETW